MKLFSRDDNIPLQGRVSNLAQFLTRYHGVPHVIPAVASDVDYIEPVSLDEVPDLELAHASCAGTVAETREYFQTLLDEVVSQEFPDPLSELEEGRIIMKVRNLRVVLRPS